MQRCRLCCAAAKSCGLLGYGVSHTPFHCEVKAQTECEARYAFTGWSAQRDRHGAFKLKPSEARFQLVLIYFVYWPLAPLLQNRSSAHANALSIFFGRRHISTSGFASTATETTVLPYFCLCSPAITTRWLKSWLKQYRPTSAVSILTAQSDSTHMVCCKVHLYRLVPIAGLYLQK